MNKTIKSAFNLLHFNFKLFSATLNRCYKMEEQV